MKPWSEGVRWGIIGAGNVCEVKSGPPLYKVEGSSLVQIMRRDAEKASDFALRHGVSSWTTDAEALISHPEINAIYIATPPDTHLHYAKLAAQAGKAVYVEKPMARTAAECEEMIGLCQRAGVPLFVAYYRRYLPLFLHIRNFIDQGFIGKIQMVEVKVHKSLKPDIVWTSANETNWRVDPEISGGGYFIDLASHQLDFLDLLLGPIKSANGFISNHGGLYQVEDQVNAIFEFSDGITGTGSWAFNLPDGFDDEKTVIYGSEGKITFTFFSDFHILLEMEGEEPQRIDYQMPEHVQQPLIEAIVQELLGGEACNSTGESALRTARVVDVITGK